MVDPEYTHTATLKKKMECQTKALNWEALSPSQTPLGKPSSTVTLDAR